MDYYTYLRNLEYLNQMQNNFTDIRVDNEPWPLTFQNKSSQYILSKAIEQVKEYITDENEDEMFYDNLISLAPSDEQKKIIADIRDDERIHVKIFRKIFTQLTGVVLPMAMPNMKKTEYENMTYMDGLKKALFGELDAIKKYRETIAYMPNKELYDMFMYVLTDEIRHADKYNYLITLNK